MNTRIYVLGEVFTNTEHLPLHQDIPYDTLMIAVDATGKNDWALEGSLQTHYIRHKLTFDDVKEPLNQCFEEIKSTHDALRLCYAPNEIAGVYRLRKLYNMKDEIIRRIKEHDPFEQVERPIYLFKEPGLRIQYIYYGLWRLYFNLN